ncbi:TPA: lipoprotein [Providencia rettgeri]
MKKIIMAFLFSVILTGCNSNKLLEAFPASVGTESMAYCVQNTWTQDALDHNEKINNIVIIENRLGDGAFYVFEDNGVEIVSAKGTYGFIGKRTSDIDINFYIAEGKTETERTKRRLSLTKMCAKIPSEERKELYLKSIVCTDLSGCVFRNKQ